MGAYIDDEVLKRYEEIIAVIPDLPRKGKTMPYTSLNGNMFSFLDKEGLMSIRLSKDDQEEFIAKHNAGPSIQYGSVMKGYVLVPNDVFENTKLIKTYFKTCYEFAKTLEPKPKKKAKA